MSDLRPYNWNTNNTNFSDWFERDRQMVRLCNKLGREIICLWDDEATQFVEDGFKRRAQSWHDALCEYATEHKLRARKAGAHA